MFYLRYFADARDQVKTVMLPGDRTFLQSIGDASVNTNFYTLIDLAGRECDAAEAAFSEVEGPAAMASRELTNDVWPLPDEHRSNMAAWLALHLLCGASVRDSMSELTGHAVLLETIIGGRKRLRETLAAQGELTDQERVNHEWINLFRNPPRAPIHANQHLQHLADLLPRVTQSLLDRSWLLTVFR